MLGEISFELIKDNFHYGYYGPFRVVVDKANGHVNATKLCRLGGKKFKDWVRLKSSHHLIEALEQDMALQNTQDNSKISNFTLADGLEHICSTPSPTCIKFIESNRTETDRLISGTYCHPLLIPHIACWVSPIFALQVSKIVNYYMEEEWRTKLQASEQSAAQLLQSFQLSQCYLNDKIAENKELETVVGEWSQAVDYKNEMIQVKDQAIEKLEEAVSDQISERQAWASTHSFTLMKLNGESSRYPYYGIRCQSRAVCSAIKKLRRKFPNSEVIYQQRKVPNAINLFSRLKSHRAIEANRNFCNPTCSEKELVHLLSNLCGTQYPASNAAPHNTCVKEESF